MIYLQLFLTFLKVGAFAFGGGYAMLSLIGDSVLKYGNALKRKHFLLFYSLSFLA